MPPKKALPHKDKCKEKTLPSTTVSSTVSKDDPSAQPSISQAEVERQFEVELVWCIQKLQVSLESGKLNSKQVQDTTKLLNKLINNTVPVIQKRQIMRLTFGDYRAKMAEEDKKYSKVNQQIKLVPVKSNKNSIFVKKKQQTQIDDLDKVKIEDNISESNFCRFGKSDNSFRFNFNSTGN